MSLQPREFFKIVRKIQLQNGELRIPKAFVEIHWKEISNPLFLILQDGSKHEIFWVERDGDIWLKKKLEKFAESLKHGYLLIFKYLGESHFRVKIYKPNALIDYFLLKMSLQPREFFKIVQNDQLQNGELRIPKAFVNIHWEEISNPLSLILQNGSKHEIFWVERHGDIWLKKNWEKFAEPLKHGYLLIFKYLGESHFRVKIYKPNELIDYFSSIKCTNEKGNVKNTNQVIIENLDESETKVATTSRRTKTGKRKINTAASRGRVVKKAKKCSGNTYYLKNTTSRRTKTGKRKINIVASRGRVVKKARKCSGNNERARNVSDENGSFYLQMSRSYVEGGELLWLPCKFSKIFRNKLEGGSARIRVGDDNDKCWEVRFIFSAFHKKFFMGKGWRLFRQECNLQIDDICKFELIQHKPVSFKITITRARNEPRPQKLQVFGRPNKKENTFKITLKSLYQVCIPNWFLKKHNICTGSMLQLKTREASWFVKVLYYSNNNYGRFSEGWRTFVSECNLKIGDTCLFKMVDEEYLVFKVSFA